LQNNSLIVQVGLTLEAQALFTLTNFDNIRAEDVNLFLLKQTYKSFLFLSDTMGNFCLAGSVQQAQQSTHLAKSLNPL